MTLRALCLLALPCVVIAQDTAPTPLLGANPLRTFVLSGTAPSNLQFVPADHPEFSEALQLTTPDGTYSQEYAVRIRVPISVPVRKGDLISATFWLRSQQEKAYTRYVSEQVVDPYTKSESALTIVTPVWQRVSLVYAMADNYKAGEANVQFWVGYPNQTIEIGGLSVLNYGATGVPANAGYDGREPDAPWRAAADDRIDKIRKADLTVEVKNASGDFVADALIKIRMKRHSFGFGSAVAGSGLLGSGSDNAKYQELTLALFNKVVLENDLKWPNWEANRQLGQNAIEWLTTNGISQIRGHNLVWPSWKWLPKDLPALTGDPDALRTRVNTHIAEEAGTLSGKLVDWDVLNEPVTNTDLQKILGNAEMVQWFKKAREADPVAKLYINDYNIVAAGGMDEPHQNAYFRIISDLIEAGAPLDGIGMQGHFGWYLTSPARVLEILDRFGSLNKEIQITEFDVDVTDLQLQADYTRDFLTLVFSHPAIKGFLMWGFWEGRHWKPQAAMYRRDWTPKPNADAYNDLVFNKWWTNVDGYTDDGGQYTTRGFLGDYEVQVLYGETTLTVPAKLEPGGTTVSVTVP